MSSLRDILDNKYNLLFAETVKDAMETAREKKPEVILLDMNMPDMSGFDALVELRDCIDTNSIPVVMITVSDCVEDEEKGFFRGASDFIKKPFIPTTVKARIKTQIEVVRQARRVERYALIDPLVDIPNRRSFDTQMELEWARAIREKTPINLLMVDLDDFMKYNEAHGSEQGDAVLQTMAKALSSTIKRKTDMAFRWGGDAFAVILQDTTLGGALRVAEDIRANVETAEIQGGSPSVTVSIGIASATPVPESNMSELITAADNALRGAKEGGKNTVRAYTVI